MQPVEGSPLYEEGTLVGIYTAMAEKSDQNQFHPQRFIYEFILLQTSDSSSKKTKKKKFKNIVIQNQQIRLGRGKSAKNVGIFDFGNTYYE